MNYEPDTSLNLSLSSSTFNHPINLDHSSPDASNLSSIPVVQLRIFSCNYCRRKFYSSQALGGHQNAHKLERTLAKKSRELGQALELNSGFIGPGSGWPNGPIVQEYRHGIHESLQEEIGQVDLSLRL